MIFSSFFQQFFNVLFSLNLSSFLFLPFLSVLLFIIFFLPSFLFCIYCIFLVNYSFSQTPWHPILLSLENNFCSLKYISFVNIYIYFYYFNAFVCESVLFLFLLFTSSLVPFFLSFSYFLLSSSFLSCIG